jgi:hypothetical protein
MTCITGGAEASVQFHVSLRVPRFVEMGGSALLFCEHGVAREQLHKVEFLRDGRKIFQFVRGRLTPYRNFTTPGAQLDWRHTNEKQVRVYPLHLFSPPNRAHKPRKPMNRYQTRRCS